MQNSQQDDKAITLLVKQQLIFASQIMRDSVETIEVHNIMVDDTLEQDHNNPRGYSSNFFSDIDINDCTQTIRARSVMQDS